ncbi:hypothetical protein HMPREF1531_01042 [Propionibacterium sp. oral taxon 192 str. F0372]|uniref:hypothetical protein n=1 Tax=Propionibacterium sp. oral taxon 192 TaxID=671222 RepID=UPI00035390B3|nr:hypothetical protein [Propionibacterium sp. oral taxon 192]EPH05613.1 hypothetical protein HMPREF1531_01042 [Propionibacterium sp. oral taxon 192 str. F0372]
MVVRVVSVVLVLVLVVSGCHRRYGPGVELEDQLEEIIRQSGISRDAQVLQMSIFVDHLVVMTSYQGKLQKLSLELGDLKLYEVTDQGGVRVRGAASLSQFDVSGLIARYREVLDGGRCENPAVYDMITPAGYHALTTTCKNKDDISERPFEDSGTVDGVGVPDFPDPFDPEQVAALARVLPKVLPQGGALTSWTVWLSTISIGQQADGMWATDIWGEPCKTTVVTISSGPPVDVGCDSNPNMTPETELPPSFLLSDYDPGFALEVAGQIKAQTGLDVTRDVFPDGSYLHFASNDGVNLYWELSTARLGLAQHPGGVIAPK